MLKQRITGLSVVVSGALFYEASPNFRYIVDGVGEKVFYVITNSEIVKKGIELDKDYGAGIFFVGGGALLLLDYILQKGKEYSKRKKFERKKFENTLNITFHGFKENWIVIKNEVEQHLNNIFPVGSVARQHIDRAAKNTSKNDVILRFTNEQEAWDIYELIRSHPKVFGDRVDVMKEMSALYRETGGKEDIHFIGAITKEPQYTITEEQKVEEAKRKDSPHTKAQIRLLMFPDFEIESAKDWLFEKCKTKQKDINFVELRKFVHGICNDLNSDCSVLNDFILYMLDTDKQETADINSLLKYPTYRKRFISLLQITLDYLENKPLLKI